MTNSNVALNQIRKKGWETKDIITSVIFSIIINIIILAVIMVGNILFTPGIAYLGNTAIMAVLCGPLYMVMAKKIHKPGILLVASIITMLIYLAMGQTYMLFMILFGFLAELTMLGKDAYRSWKRNAIGYGLFFAGYALCGVLPLIFFRERYLALFSDRYDQEGINTLVYYYGTPSMIFVMVVLAIIGGFIGSWMGNNFMKRHVQKAKLL